MQDEFELRERIIRDPGAPAQLWDFFVADELTALVDEINEIAEELNVDPNLLFPRASWAGQGLSPCMRLSRRCRRRLRGGYCATGNIAT